MSDGERKERENIENRQQRQYSTIDLETRVDDALNFLIQPK
jgi:hypothetical protein